MEGDRTHCQLVRAAYRAQQYNQQTAHAYNLSMRIHREAQSGDEVHLVIGEITAHQQESRRAAPDPLEYPCS
jgi:hypothetical protein